MLISEHPDPMAEIKKDIEQKLFVFNLSKKLPNEKISSGNFLFENRNQSPSIAVQKADRIGPIPDAVEFNKLIHLVYSDGDLIFFTNKIADTKIFIKNEPSKSETLDLETNFTRGNGAEENKTITVGALSKGNYYYAVFNTAAIAGEEAWFFGKLTVL